jgi:hypothetical protein
VLGFEVVEGAGAGRRIELTGPVELGRGPDAGVRIDDPLVSRLHAGLAPDRDGVVVHDLDSSNGTFVNGSQIHGPARLVPGDQLLLGATVLELRTRVQLASGSAAVPAPEGHEPAGGRARGEPPTGRPGPDLVAAPARPDRLPALALGLIALVTLVLLIAVGR